MRALRWARMVAGVLLFFALNAAGVVGVWCAIRARKLDERLDAWRRGLQPDGLAVRLVVERVARHVESGATTGTEKYPYLDLRDMELLARAIDNLGCYAAVWPLQVHWNRRDVKPTGRTLSLAALPPADRDAWVEAIGNLDGEGEP